MLMGYGIVTTVTKIGMVGVGADFGEDLPATFAFLAASDFYYHTNAVHVF